MSARAAGLALALALLVGCAQAPVPQDHFYRVILPPPAARLAQPPLDAPLTVQRLAADGLTGERALVYTLGERPEDLMRYHYHFWTDPPGRMLQEQLTAYLRAAGVAPIVVMPDVRTGSAHVLSGRIKRFEQVLGAQPGVVVSLELALNRRDGGELLMLRDYDVHRPVESDAVAAAVRALRDALAEVAAQVAADIAAL